MQIAKMWVSWWQGTASSWQGLDPVRSALGHTTMYNDYIHYENEENVLSDWLLFMLAHVGLKILNFEISTNHILANLISVHH